MDSDLTSHKLDALERKVAELLREAEGADLATLTTETASPPRLDRTFHDTRWIQPPPRLVPAPIRFALWFRVRELYGLPRG